MTLIQSIRFAVRGQRRFASIAAACTLLPFVHSVALAAEDEELSEVVVQGDRMNVMQTQPVDSVFGFGKKVDETPRAITTISNELLEQTIITEIDDLVALTPARSRSPSSAWPDRWTCAARPARTISAA
ncbi:MAG: hypothetical protein WDO12_07820 [Pseudomonadota bacterium]